MSQGNRQNRQFALTYDQRLLLDMYINFYNHTTRQMDALYDLQSEIRGNINQIIGLSPIHINSHNSHRNFNETFTNNRQHSQNSSNRRSNQNRNHQNGESSIPSTNSRVVYIEGVPYLLDFTNFARLRNSNPDAANLWRSFYDNITVAPTRTQIENATRILQFSEITTPINSSCPITLERFDAGTSVTQILHCGHIFTPSGIDSWFQSNVRCPVCRYDIRDYRAPPLPSSTREERHRGTEPGNDEESKEEERLEETKEDISSPSPNNGNERTSNSTRRNLNQNNRRITSENVTNVLSNITEEIINNIFQQPGGSGTRSVFDPSQNSLFYDSSNNQFIFEGFIRR